MSNPPPPPPPPPSNQRGPLQDVADGQRMIIYGILANIGAIIVRLSLGDVGILITLAAVVLAIMGVLKLASGLGYSTGIKVLLVILMFLPLISIVTLAILSSRANERLKSAGYKVGLLGAKR